MNERTVTEWDNRQMFNERLHLLCKTADQSRFIDDFDNWYDALVGIDTMIDFYYTKEERTVIAELMKKARGWAKAGSHKYAKVSKDLVYDHLNTLGKELYRLAHKYKLMQPRSERAGTDLGND